MAPLLQFIASPYFCPTAVCFCQHCPSAEQLLRASPLLMLKKLGGPFAVGGPCGDQHGSKNWLPLLATYFLIALIQFYLCCWFSAWRLCKLRWLSWVGSGWPGFYCRHQQLSADFKFPGQLRQNKPHGILFSFVYVTAYSQFCLLAVQLKYN